MTTPVGRTTYRLTEQLHFVPAVGDAPSPWPAGSPATSVVLPAVRPEISCSGTQNSHVGWRHTNGMPAGTHTAYLVLLTSEHDDHVHVIAEGHYDYIPQAGVRLRPASTADAFVVRLPRNEHERPEPAPPAIGGRVLVSYAPEHESWVRSVEETLTKAGFRVESDRCPLPSAEECGDWVTTQALRADHVIVVTSQSYVDATRAVAPTGDRLRAKLEHGSFAGLLARNGAKWARKFLLVRPVANGEPAADVPRDWLPEVTELTVEKDSEAGLDELLEWLARAPTA
ncbi:toll/interleukin-1 receptor domain-containing protein [Lentzea sp. NEAU-D7]|uniref:toll/interleukin-1 receptor domain-containing protein n=1 Tax=Lentzea sp. NEAU-D7 TaxID=2994667 RepID=UPI00224B807F|nr:toll/interleukin-1 receptor domain-containing protein [Lentzea sp. NEAU-D7]MCX2950168.1 TIR domain-containing protein [Lentzea sp. NEAU-D7]